MQRFKSLERLEALSSPLDVATPITAKDQEAHIQELKKENFDLKLRLFMESKEFDKSIRDDQRTIADLENEISDILQELQEALQREKQLEAELDASKRREKAFINKQKRLEQALSEKDEEISYLNRELVKLSIGSQNDSFYSSEVNFKKFEEELEPEEQPNIDEIKGKLFIGNAEPERENDLNQSPEDNTKSYRSEYVGSLKNHQTENIKIYGQREPIQGKLSDAHTKSKEYDENSSVDENDSNSSSYRKHKGIKTTERSSKHYHENNIPSTQLKEKTYEKYREVCVDDGSSVERVRDKKGEGKDDIQFTNLTNISDVTAESVPDVRTHEYRKKEKISRESRYLYNNGVIAGSQRSRSIDDLYKNDTKKDKKKGRRKMYKMLCCLAPKLNREDNGSIQYKPSQVHGVV